MKKTALVITVLIAIVMIFGLSAACNRSSDDDTGGSATTQTGSDGGAATDSGGGSGAATDSAAGGQTDTGEPVDIYRDVSEFVTLSISTIAPNEDAGKNLDGEFSEHLLWLYDTYNFEFDFWSGLTWDNYIDVTNLWMLSDVLPDLIFMDVQSHRFGQWLNWQMDGKFRAYEMEHYPNIKEIMDNGTPGMQKFVIDGVLWTYPAWIDRIHFTGSSGGRHGFMYRRDWAEQVGHYKEDGYYTWDEFITMLRAVLAADPAGNGRTIGVSGIDWSMPRYWGGGAYSPYFMGYSPDGEGGYAWAPSLPGSLEAVRLMNWMYHEGLMWEDQYMVFDEDVQGAWTGNRLFARVVTGFDYGYLSNQIWIYAESEFGSEDPDYINKTLDRMDIGVYATPSGDIVQYWLLDSWSETGMRAALSDTSAYRWQNILDFLCTDEGYFFRNMGIKGQDWDYGEDGRPVHMWTNIDEQSGLLVAPHNGYNWFAWARTASASDGFNELFNTDFLHPRIKAIEDKINAIYRRDNVMYVPELIEIAGLDAENFPAFLRTGTRERQTIAQVQRMLLVAPEDVDKEWNDWVASQMPLFQDTIDELNAAFKR